MEMTENRLILEEKIFMAIVKLYEIQWQIVREKDTPKIITEVEKVQSELQMVQEALK